MAIIKIKNIKSNLQRVIEYGENGDKTENGILVSSINCAVDTAYEEMAHTKRFYHKEDKILGYHIIQSFNGFETTPQNANKIGKQLAEELWGDRFQVVICTHINKKNVHNHIILNSVSCVDGKKYHNSKTNIAFIKDISDRLCMENGLSIIRTLKSNIEQEFREKRIDYFNRSNEKMKKVITDIDETIKSVKTYSDFKLVLKSKGYSKINDYGKFLSLKTPYFSRNVRIDKIFGYEYSVYGIKERIYYNINKKLPPVANLKKQYYRKVYTGIKINENLLKTSSFYRLYVSYLYAFKILPAKNEYQKLTPEYYKQKRENNMIFEELNFITRNKIEKIENVIECKSKLEQKLPHIKSQRENLWRKYNKLDEGFEKTTLLDEIKKLTEKIDTVQSQKNTCNRIISRYEEIKEECLRKIEEGKKFVELAENEKKRKKERRR